MAKQSPDVEPVDDGPELEVEPVAENPPAEPVLSSTSAEKIADLEIEKQRLRDKIRELEAQLNQSQNDLAEAQAFVQAERAIALEAQGEAERFKAEAAGYAEVLEDAQTRAGAAEAAAAKATEELDAAKEEIVNLRPALEAAESTRDLLARDKAALEERIAEQSVKLEALDVLLKP